MGDKTGFLRLGHKYINYDHVNMECNASSSMLRSSDKSKNSGSGITGVLIMRRNTDSEQSLFI